VQRMQQSGKFWRLLRYARNDAFEFLLN